MREARLDFYELPGEDLTTSVLPEVAGWISIYEELASVLGSVLSRANGSAESAELRNHLEWIELRLAAWRDRHAALAGAILASLLWEVAKQLFRLYIQQVGIYNQIYGQLGILPHVRGEIHSPDEAGSGPAGLSPSAPQTPVHQQPARDAGVAEFEALRRSGPHLHHAAQEPPARGWPGTCDHCRQEPGIRRHGDTR